MTLMEATELYLKYKPKLLSICKQYAKEDSVAEDLLHDSFVIILTSLDTLEDPSKLEPWITAIVRNVGYHYRLHAEKEQAVLQQMAKDANINPDVNPIPDYDQLQALVAQLPKGYQQVFRLSVFEGLSHQEISHLLGIAPHTSSSQLSHAKRMLRLLIRQSWMLMLLLLMIPAVVWRFVQKQQPTPQKPTARRATQQPQPTKPADKPEEQPITVAANCEGVDIRQNARPIRYQAEAVILPDSIPYQQETIEQENKGTEVWEHENKSDNGDIKKNTNIMPPYLHTTVPLENAKTQKWNVSVAFNGQMGRGDTYLASAFIGRNSFNANSNSLISSKEMFSNWNDYEYFLNNNPGVILDEETRSILVVTEYNAYVNNGAMEANYEHHPPVTLQVMFSHSLGRKASIETGLSYTQLSSTTTTGSTAANIQEQQRLRYLGLPLRLGWQWYGKKPLCIYTSAGAMLEWPVHSTLDVQYMMDGKCIFKKKTSPSVPLQWSATLGIGMQYDLTPSIGIFAEPGLQYFFNDGSELKSYRTEHPLQINLPIGIRFHW